MPKDEWGVKRLCPHCASRFYDLQRDPMTCPECGHSFSAESLIAGRGRTMISEKTASKTDDLDVDDLTDDDDLDDDSGDSDLDDDLLEDDSDDDVSLDEIADVATGEDDS
ncbi:TIGR02300 family protein [Defluviimonas sp. WL0024]|uniref:TIGR02300 family protein n=2 Tax=Albidovulum TaxID=205889 RepID=A0ABT3J8K3_9RHOB|nr:MULTISPECIES: TIGR02300 family protein [Defluviimonas]MCU9848809.1 TIGR02300 family protein [Defluviimonas sp. WL0024]MCW3784026.1 TIGR02300 family protein [Defluviimonas salinarum]